MKKGERKVSREGLFGVLREYPLINANHLASELGVHYYTARKYLIDLEDAGILKREIRRRDKYEVVWWKVIGDVAQTKLDRLANPKNSGKKR